MKEYTIKYHDDQNSEHEFSIYANDSFDARNNAIQTNKYLEKHPNCIHSISTYISQDP